MNDYLQHFVLFSVDVRLHESLLATAYSPSDVDIEMMSLSAQLDTLCKKELVMVLYIAFSLKKQS